MAIHTADGQNVPDGERGEIVIRGSNVMREYDAMSEANASVFQHGWFRSGDEGFRLASEDGRHYYFITGRLKELIIRGGVNISPLEIDEVLAGAPGVKSAICVGFDHDMYGEEIGALVIPEDSSASESAILSYCRSRLPFAKSPKVILFVDELPVTSTGKYQRTKVRHLFTQFRAVRFSK
jgi:long-chain acyl-CoA synthetase